LFSRLAVFSFLRHQLSPEGTMAVQEDIRLAMAGRTVEATDRLTKVVILETSKVVINTVSTSNSQTGSSRVG